MKIVKTKNNLLLGNIITRHYNVSYGVKYSSSMGLHIKNMETTTKVEMLTLTPAKIKEWRKWGNEAYKSFTHMMQHNSHHPDYDTLEKREAIHDANEKGEGQGAYNFSENGIIKLKTKWGYSEQAIQQAKTAWISGYSASRKWYKREDTKYQAILDSYAPLFKEASEIAFAVDVSDIKDGFPCGYAHVYLDYACRETDLGKALAHFNDSATIQYKYKINIKMPVHGQCIAFSERLCSKVAEFLRQNNVLVNTYSWID